jgi:hypothetical protein
MASDLSELEQAIAVMRAAGRTHVPIRIEVLEKILHGGRRRLHQSDPRPFVTPKPVSEGGI